MQPLLPLAFAAVAFVGSVPAFAQGYAGMTPPDYASAWKAEQREAKARATTPVPEKSRPAPNTFHRAGASRPRT
jgi:hypothetical protein